MGVIQSMSLHSTDSFNGKMYIQRRKKCSATKAKSFDWDGMSNDAQMEGEREGKVKHKHILLGRTSRQREWKKNRIDVRMKSTLNESDIGKNAPCDINTKAKNTMSWVNSWQQLYAKRVGKSEWDSKR